ncbi:MAG TPA: hypothetical protein VKZ44_02775 [Taishania sp.]|nr:hypothetical protein [Taishania sp.]
MLLQAIKYLYPNFTVCRPDGNIKKLAVNDVIKFQYNSQVQFGFVSNITKAQVTVKVIQFNSIHQHHGSFSMNDCTTSNVKIIPFKDILEKCEITCGFVNRFAVLQTNKVVL